MTLLPRDLYRAVWRWHFYAGLLVLPFMLLLAVTGAIYLFHNELDAIIYRDLKTVQSSALSTAPPLSADTLVAKALAVHPGIPFKYTPPACAACSAEVSIQATGGDKLSVFVEPKLGLVLGDLPDRGGFSWTVRKLHSLKYFGTVASGLIEIAAGWSILLVLTGIYLWWPRQVLTVRGRPRQRVFWRDLHAVTGIVAGAFLLFLALTGMPWSVLWGAKVNQWANGSNFGYPAGVRIALPMSDEHLNHKMPVAWSMEQAQMPLSQQHEHHHGAPQPPSVTLQQAVSQFSALGLAPGFAVSLPGTTMGVYTGSVYPADLSRQRVVHLDRFSGQVLLDMSYADYGPLGKGLEWGINVHLGQQYGLANQLLMLAACLAIVLLCISAAMMWWKRRPPGSLGVPPPPADRRALRGVFALLLIGGVIFPLVGLSMLVMLGLDWLGMRFFSRTGEP